MNTNSKIDACYMTQAENLYKKQGFNPKGVEIEKAASLFDAIDLNSESYKHSVPVYLRKIDANDDKLISIEELAKTLQRADKKAFKNSTNPIDTTVINDQTANEFEIKGDFVAHGLIPYLLEETKSKTTPEQYKKVEKRIKNGTFTVTGETRKRDINLLKTPINGSDFSDAIDNISFRYEELKKESPQLTTIFLNKLANGQVPYFMYDKETATFATKEVDKQQNTFIELETFSQKDATRLATKQIAREKESISEITKITYNGKFKDPLAETTAKKLCKEVLTDEMLEYFEQNILEAIDNPEKFSEIIKHVEEPIKRTLGLNTSMFASKTRNDISGEQISEKNQIIIAYQAFKDLKTGYEEAGVPTNKIKENMIKNLIGTIGHEYWHVIEDTLIKNSKGPMAKKYKANDDNYIDYEDSIKVYGSSIQYSEQPLEKNSFILEAYISKFIKNWYAKRNGAAQ